MPAYVPLNDEEAPAIPSVDQLRSGSGETSAKMKQVAYAPVEKTLANNMVKSQIASSPAASAPSHTQNKYIVSSCCCGCTLSTGVYLISLVETISCIFGLFAAALAIYFKTQENKIDHQIYKYDASAEQEEQDGTVSTDTESHSEDEMTTDEKVEHVNHIIDVAAYTSPFLIILSLVALFFSYKGFQAAKGDANAALVYYKWKKVAILLAFIQMVSGDGFGGFIGFLVAIYYCIVVRSHWLALSSTEAEPTTAESSVVVVTTVTEA